VLIHGATDKDIHPPLFGAAQRAFGLYRGLAQRHQVHVLCMVPYRSGGAHEERAAGVHLSRRRAWYTSAAWRLERLGLAPLTLAAHGHRAAARRLSSLLGGRADALLVDLQLSGLFEHSTAALKVYLSHNVEADLFAALAPRMVARGAWVSWVRALEARAAARADLVVAVSDEDATRFGALYGVPPERLAVIPNGYDETAVRPPSPDERARARAALGIGEGDYACVFVGSDFAPNLAALSRLLAAFPALASKGFRLIAAGRATRVLAGRAEPWLIVGPEVDDLTPFLHAADAGLNPVASGGGSNVKLPTYLAAGLAVLTTRFGLRGYPDLEPLVGVVDADPTRLAAALARRPAGWRARGLPVPPALEAYAWGRLGARLGEILASHPALAGGAPAPTAVAGRAQA